MTAQAFFYTKRKESSSFFSLGIFLLFSPITYPRTVPSCRVSLFCVFLPQLLTEWLGAHQFFDAIAADEAVLWHWLEAVADQHCADAAQLTARDHALAAYADSLTASAHATAVANANSTATAASAPGSIASPSSASTASLAVPPPPSVMSTAQLRDEVESLLRARVSQQPALTAAWRHLVASSVSAPSSSSAPSISPLSEEELSALAAAQTDELDAFAVDFSAHAVAMRSAARLSVAALNGAAVIGGAPHVASSVALSHSQHQNRHQQGMVFSSDNIVFPFVRFESSERCIVFEMLCGID